MRAEARALSWRPPGPRSLAITDLDSCFPRRRRRSAHKVIREHGPAARLVVFVLVVQRPPAVPGRHRHLAGSLVGPEPGSPALAVLLVPGLPLAVQVGRAGWLGYVVQVGSTAAPAVAAALR